MEVINQRDFGVRFVRTTWNNLIQALGLVVLCLAAIFFAHFDSHLLLVAAIQDPSGFFSFWGYILLAGLGPVMLGLGGLWLIHAGTPSQRVLKCSECGSNTLLVKKTLLPVSLGCLVAVVVAVLSWGWPHSLKWTATPGLWRGEWHGSDSTLIRVKIDSTSLSFFNEDGEVWTCQGSEYETHLPSPLEQFKKTLYLNIECEDEDKYLLELHLQGGLTVSERKAGADRDQGSYMQTLGYFEREFEK